jgi:GntR family transcriptional regulator
MDFKENEAIYLQIAALVCDNILSGKLPENEKILSVRDLAVELEVNPNTVMRSYEFLQSIEVIYNRRGLGLYVTADAFKKVKSLRKKNFFAAQLPDLFKEMYLLDITSEEISGQYEKYLSSKQAHQLKKEK